MQSPVKRGGAPAGNQSAVKLGTRRGEKPPKDSAGSRLPKGCGRVHRHVTSLVERAKADWRAKHNHPAAEPLPLAVDRIVHQIRRAEERDRLAAKQLADGKSLRGEPLTFDQTQQLQDAQEKAGRLIESLLKKLGLTAESAAEPEDWNKVLREEAEKGDTALNAAERPGRFSGGSKPLDTSEAVRVPCRNGEKPTDGITA